MSWNTDPLLKTCGHPANREVIAYLQTQSPSAHSDIAEELINSAASLPEPERQWFCPNPRSYAYVALHLPNGIIYALAIGMQTLVFRLPENPRPPDVRVAASGKKQPRPFTEISGDWWTFEMFRDGDVAGDRAWARLLTESAYRWARSLPTPNGET